MSKDLVRLGADNSSNYNPLAQELNIPKIQDGSKTMLKGKNYNFSANHFTEGFVLFPANFGDPINLDRNLILKPQGEPVKKVPGGGVNTN